MRFKFFKLVRLKFSRFKLSRFKSFKKLVLVIYIIFKCDCYI